MNSFTMLTEELSEALSREQLVSIGNSGKRGQAFRTNGALSPILSVRSTALYR